MADESRSLWEQFDSEVEPWRRGRMVLVLIGLLNLILQALALTVWILLADIERILPLTASFAIFWLQFYFIWIGVHWIRWLSGAWSGLTGFGFLIWSIRDSDGIFFVIGGLNLLIGACLCLPSVYFFAKRQRERRNWLHSIVIAAVMGMMILTLLFGSMGIQGYRAFIENEAQSFADETFSRVFTEHDTYYFLDHMTQRGLAATGGRAGATKFLQYTTLNAGDVQQIKPASTQVRIRYQFPMEISCIGVAVSEAKGAKGPLQLRIDIVQEGRSWKFNSIFWQYRNPYPGSK